MKDQLVNFLKGLLMGTADIIPGVSGGTIALITGIYQRLIDAIDYLVDFVKPKNWKKFPKRIKKADYSLLVPLVIGIGTAFLLLSNAIHYMLEEQAAYTYSFFFGLIIASAIFLFRKMHFNLTSSLYIVLGALAGYVIVGLGQANANHSLPVLFGSGAVAITAMILPGISGSFMLLLMNQYEYVIGLISGFVVGELVVFAAGAVLGLLLFTKILHFLLHKFKNRTFGFLVGLMIGSLRLPYVIVKSEPGLYSMIFVFGVIGFTMVFLIDWLAQRYK